MIPPPLRRCAPSPLRALVLIAGCLAFAACTVQRPSGPTPSAAETGQRLFENYCASCHQYDGQGMGDAPPLENAVFVAGPASRLIRIILGGVAGRMEIQGVVYDREMPGFGAVLSDSEVATLATFIRRRFAGLDDPIRPEAVAQWRDPNRTSYWSVDELLAP